MKRLCADTATLIENYETSPVAEPKLRRKRRRRNSSSKPDATKFRLLVEGLVCDLAHRNALEPDGWLVVSRRNDDIAGRSRYKPEYLGKPLPHLLDTLATPEIGFIEQRLGKHVRGTTFGNSTMIRPTKRLRDRFEQHDAGLDSVKLRHGEEVVVLRGNRDDDFGNPREWLEYPDDAQTEKLRADLRRINNYLEAEFETNADGTVDTFASDGLPIGVDPTAVRMRRFFTHGSFTTGGRLYHGFWQRLTRDQRASLLTIQNESTVTLDYSQAALRIAYGVAGAPLPDGDGYAITRLEGYRTATKRLVNSMLFPRQPHWKLLIPKTIKKKLPDLPEIDIVEAVKAHHPALADYWWTDIGHRIQRIESDIIVECLLQCIDRDIVALQVHDALIIPRSAEATVRKIMVETFERIAGVPAGVTTE
ncbi:MAG: hypothetical protein AAF351_01960 [Pseudomonadota bacterium]